MFTPGDHQYQIDRQRRSRLLDEASRQRQLPPKPAIRLSLRPLMSLLSAAVVLLKAAFRYGAPVTPRQRSI